MITRRRFLQISAISAAAATGLPVTPANSRVWRGVAMGADCSITLTGDTADAERALAAARDTISRMEKLFSLYDPASALSRLNATGNLDPAPPEFLRLADIIDTVHRATGGRFDPTVQPLFAAQLRAGHALDRDALASFHDVLGWEKVARDGSRVTLRPGMALTFNGIAQGFATDRAFETLAAHGFTATTVNIGEYRAGDTTSPLGIADPAGALIDRVDLVRSAIATSSATGFRFADGSSHILDPGGNSDVSRRWQTVSVRAQTAAMADGLSTAISLTGDETLARSCIDAGFCETVWLHREPGDSVKIG